MACHQFTAKPFSEAMLAYCQLDLQQDLNQNTILMKNIICPEESNALFVNVLMC